MDKISFEDRLKAYAQGFHPVVHFTKDDTFLFMDFTAGNTSLTDDILANTERFTAYIENKMGAANARFGIGGYNEHRTIYSRSKVFDGTSPNPSKGGALPAHNGQLSSDAAKDKNSSQSGPGAKLSPPLEEPEEIQPRRLHLGIDIWGPAGTPVYSPMEGTVHSVAFNDVFGDYGATLILQHELEGSIFHTLYGHLSLASITEKKEGQDIAKGDWIAAFGEPSENGHWPPHLHFQMVIDMKGMKGDYPGVCKFSERDHYLANCPDPDLILGMMARAKKVRDE